MNTTRYGTCHFTSKFRAIRYYELFGYDRADVMRKLAEGEICIGPPALKPGEKLGMMEGGRYAVEVADRPKFRDPSEAIYGSGTRGWGVNFFGALVPSQEF